MQGAIVPWPRLRWSLAATAVVLVALGRPVEVPEPFERVDEPLCRNVPVDAAAVDWVYEIGAYHPRFLHGRLDTGPRIAACGIGVVPWWRMTEPLVGATRDGLEGRVIYDLGIGDAEARAVAPIVWDNPWPRPPGLVISRSYSKVVIDLYLLLVHDPQLDPWDPCGDITPILMAIQEQSSRVFGERVAVKVHPYRDNCDQDWHRVHSSNELDAQLVWYAASGLHVTWVP